MSENDQATEDLRAKYEEVLKQRDRLIATLPLCDEIDKIAISHNLTHKDCVEILETVAPLFDYMGTPNDAKKSLQRSIQTIIAVIKTG